MNPILFLNYSNRFIFSLLYIYIRNPYLLFNFSVPFHLLISHELRAKVTSNEVFFQNYNLLEEVLGVVGERFFSHLTKNQGLAKYLGYRCSKEPFYTIVVRKSKVET
jgi:hypothetical protein